MDRALRRGVRQHYRLALALLSDQAATLHVQHLDEPLRMYLHGPEDRHVSTTIREQGQWEPFESQLLLRSVQPGGRVLDVGANLGYFSLLAAVRVGQAGHVYAFEPEPRNYRLLEKNIQLNGFEARITPCEAGLSDAAGSAPLYLSNDNLGDHQLRPDVDGRAAISVRLEEGNAWFTGREERLDFVKVDVQGAEHAVINGLLPLLQASGPTLRLLLELTPLSLRNAGTSGAALIATLSELDLPFHIVDHVEHRLVATDAEALTIWSNNVDSVRGDAGFMNILLGCAV